MTRSPGLYKSSSLSLQKRNINTYILEIKIVKDGHSIKATNKNTYFLETDQNELVRSNS
jgi:hypothetical protein